MLFFEELRAISCPLYRADYAKDNNGDLSGLDARIEFLKQKIKESSYEKDV